MAFQTLSLLVRSIAQLFALRLGSVEADTFRTQLESNPAGLAKHGIPCLYFANEVIIAAGVIDENVGRGTAQTLELVFGVHKGALSEVENAEALAAQFVPGVAADTLALVAPLPLPAVGVHREADCIIHLVVVVQTVLALGRPSLVLVILSGQAVCKLHAFRNALRLRGVCEPEAVRGLYYELLRAVWRGSGGWRRRVVLRACVVRQEGLRRG